MRGSLTFSSLFADQTPTPTRQEGKGRSADLNAQRDELIICRYYYYGTYTPFRYERIISSLKAEFFLTERRIIDIISENAHILRQLRNNPLKLSQLQDKYPHLVWRHIMPPAPKATPIQL